MPLSRTARALSATAFTTLVLGTAATAATANSGAEVSPRTVAPGGSVTVSVTCASTGGNPPGTIEAASRAFEHGSVRLHRTGHRTGPGPGAGSGFGSGHEEDPAGPDDPMGADIPTVPTAEDEPMALDDATAPEDPGPDEGPSGADELGGQDDPAGKEKPGGDVTYSGTARIASAAHVAKGGPDAVGGASEWSVDGVCPGEHGGERKKWSASFTVSPDDSHGTGDRHGVHAGEGGTFNDSTIALVSGGVLIAGALGAAAHRLRHRGETWTG
ncbi:hypothetical protein ACLVWQ_21695 [Streptomyces sp. CWNU-52B]|uniref:hypothetical protein n=1 Tax=unclassified Streptomyces TaxID=2593676 RepID=UPI0039C43F5C